MTQRSNGRRRTGTSSSMSISTPRRKTMSDNDWGGDWDGERVTEQTTPNGTVIGYHSKPKRFYELDKVEAECSVSEPLKCLDKPALPQWGMRVGIAAVLDLHRLGITTEMLLRDKPAEMEMIEWGRLIGRGVVTE